MDSMDPPARNATALDCVVGAGNEIAGAGMRGGNSRGVARPGKGIGATPEASAGIKGATSGRADC
eukprot:1479352-Alexandrium_andersonii.AAC.1